jgi:hypothetical protein
MDQVEIPNVYAGPLEQIKGVGFEAARTGGAACYSSFDVDATVERLRDPRARLGRIREFREADRDCTRTVRVFPSDRISIAATPE